MPFPHGKTILIGAVSCPDLPDVKLRKFLHAERIFQILRLQPCILLHLKIPRNLRSFMDKESVGTQNSFLNIHVIIGCTQLGNERAG